MKKTKRSGVVLMLLICLLQVCACGNSNANMNGNVIGDGNVVVINGENVVDNSKNSQIQKFDEIKMEDIDNIEKVVIESSIADVNITTTNASKAKAYLYGIAEVDNELDFSMKRSGNELRIAIKYDGIFKGDLKVEVMLPDKLFEEVCVQTVSANISSNRVFARKIEVNTQAGNIDFSTNAKSDVYVNLATVSGSISAKFNNIEQIELDAHAISGKVQTNRKQDAGGYTAKADINTVSGDININ